MSDRFKLCLSQTTTLPRTWSEDIADYAAGGWPGVEIWLTKLEKHLDNSTLDDTIRQMGERKIVAAAAAYQGGLLLSQGEARKSHFDHFRRRLELCQALSCPTMLIVADFQQRFDETTLQRAVVSLKQAAQWAAGFDVRIGLEFRGSDTFCSCLDTAISLVDQCEEPNLGVCLDLFHYYTGASKPEDLDRLTKENLAHVQLSDLAGVPRELAGDSDRVMPGDGDFRFDGVVETLDRIGYDGWVGLELFNPVLWQMKSTQVAELGYTALSRVLKSAAP